MKGNKRLSKIESIEKKKNTYHDQHPFHRLTEILSWRRRYPEPSRSLYIDKIALWDHTL